MKTVNGNSLKVVVKIEIKSLSDPDGNLDEDKLERLVMILSNLHNSGMQILVVSSGAIALGSKRMGLKSLPEDHIQMQAMAAIGQAELIKVYQHYFEEYNQVVAQILLTNQAMTNADRQANARNTFSKLLDKNIIPVINENDTVSTEDIELNDNYPLVLNVARLVDAHIILIKSVADGRYMIVPAGTTTPGIIVNEEELPEKLAKVAGEKSLYESESRVFPEKYELLNFQ